MGIGVMGSCIKEARWMEANWPRTIAMARDRMTSGIKFLILAMAILVCANEARSQTPQTTLQVPRQVLSNSFYERFGVHWGFRGRGFFFDNGGPGPVPVFGGFDPNTQGHFGWGGRNGFLSIYAGTGSSRSMTSDSVMLTMPNGGAGMISSSSLRPFVTGVSPVVGDGSLSPVAERLHRLSAGEKPYSSENRTQGESRLIRLATSSNTDSSKTASSAQGPYPSSTAERGERSVAEIQRFQREEKERVAAEVEQLQALAVQAEQRGQWGVARIYYQRAAKSTTGDERQTLITKIREMSRRTKGEPPPEPPPESPPEPPVEPPVEPGPEPGP